MAIIKKTAIIDSLGVRTTDNIGAEAENIDVSRDDQGQIITDLSQETADSVEGLSTTLKKAETNIDSLVDNVKYNGAYNLLKVSATTQTVNGVTFTVNTDGTISLSGTASSDIEFYISPTYSQMGLQSGVSYKLSGCPSGGSVSTYCIGRVFTKWSLIFEFEFGNGATFTLSDDDVYDRLLIMIKSDVNVDGLVFKPMLTLASQPDSDYEHFVPFTNYPNSALLPLAGGTVTGTINRDNAPSTSYIAGPSGNSGLHINKAEGSIWYPMVSTRTAGGGGWAIGNYNNENLQFVYGTKENITSGTNTTLAVNLPPTAGTIALTSQLTNGSVTKVGTSTAGSANRPIYLNAGAPTTCNAFVPTSGGTFTAGVTINKGSATTAADSSILTLGNSTASGTTGNSYGLLRLYSSNSSYTNLIAQSATSASSLYLPTGHNGEVLATQTQLSSYMPKAGGTFTGNVTVDRANGTTSTTGTSYLIAGNNKSGSTAGNSQGWLRLYSEAGGYADVRAADSTAGPRNIMLPNATGTVALTSNLSSYVPKSGGDMTGKLSCSANIQAVGTICSGAGSFTVDGTTYTNESGILRLFDSSSHYVSIVANGSMSGNRTVTLPATTGTLSYSSSSRRVKKNIRNMTEEEAKKLLDIDIIKFDYKEFWNDGEKNQSGLIAEDVIKIIPEAVLVRPDYDPNLPVDEEYNFPPEVNYSKFVPYLIKMVQMQQTEINELKEILASINL